MGNFESIKGRAWVFGDNVDTDQIIQGIHLTMLDYSEMAKHTFEMVRPEFTEQVKPGDIIVAGRNFGGGSSREEAPMVLKELGIRLVIAESFARIFYRNAFNVGIPALLVKDISSHVTDGHTVEANVLAGKISIVETGVTLDSDKLPDMMLELLKAGGAIPHYKKLVNK